MAGMSCLAALLMLLFTMVAAVREAQAVPAAPFVHQLRQPDGSPFAARQWGDEFRAGWETETGYTILFDPRMSSWTYAELDSSGDLKSSRSRVGKDTPPETAKRLRPEKSHGLSRTARPFAGAAAGAASAPEATTQTTRNIPVILINFSNTATTYGAADFSSLLFSSGNWSFRDYYEEVSGGALTVTPGPAGVSGWYTAVNGHDYYGQPSGWGPPDKWPGDLAWEAVVQADAAMDYSAYDADGDCVVDVVAIVHQGPAQEASGTHADIWSHSWSLSVTYGYGLSHHSAYTTNDICPTDPGRFMLVDDYIMMPETLPPAVDPGMTTMGVFAHEYGHALGLIDLYDSDRSSHGVGVWSLMAHGSWGRAGRAGDRPSHVDPWSKRALGWIEPTPIIAGETGKALPAVVASGQVWQFREGSEFFLVENRQLTGFDAALPGAGLLLWHIDESRTNNSSEWYPECTSCTSHYKVSLVQADNSYALEHKTDQGNAGDPFPGSAGNRAVSHLTSPFNRLYNGYPAGFALNAVSDAAPLMTADIILADGVPPTTTITANPPMFSNSATASFSFTAGEESTFECRLDTRAYLPCTSPHALAGLAEGQHSFLVRATDLTGTLEPVPPACTWTVDTVPPETTLLGAPLPLTADVTASFNFSGSETGVTFACSLDGGLWDSCVSPLNLTGLADGAHSFTVRATDPTGNTDPTPAACGWTVARNVLLSRSGQPDSFHITLGSALATVPAGTPAMLLARDVEITEDVVMNSCGTVTLLGGQASGFSTVVGQTTVVGSVGVNCGTLVVAGLSIRQD